MKNAFRTIERASIALALSAVAWLLPASAASAQGISVQQNAGGLSIFSAAEPTFFSPARNTDCEATQGVVDCDSFTVTIRNEGGQPTGVVKVGDEQICEPGVWDATNPPSEFKYEWLRDVAATGATVGLPTVVSGEAQGYTPTYTPTVNDAGFTLTCRVIATTKSATEESFGSTIAYSQPLRIAPLPGGGLGVFSTLSKTGNVFESPRVLREGFEPNPAQAAVGDALVCSPGNWSALGNSQGQKVKLLYRWLVDGQPQPSIAASFEGAFHEDNSFKVPVEAEGKPIQCEVVATTGVEGRTAVYAASQNRVIAEPLPVDGEAPRLAGANGDPFTPDRLTLTNTPVISGVKLIMKDIVPNGVTAVGIAGSHFRGGGDGFDTPVLPCELSTTLTCTLKVPLALGDGVTIKVFVTTQASEGEIDPNGVEVFDGKEPPMLLRSSEQEPEGKILAAPIGEGPPIFDVRAASLQTFGAAGRPDTQASVRPGAVTSGIQFPTVAKGPKHDVEAEGINVPPKSANVRDVRVTLPPGLVGNPLATLRCTEAKVGALTCPGSAQVGAFEFILEGSFQRVGAQGLPLFNTIPAEGYPAEFGGLYLNRFVGIYPSLVRAPASQGGYTVRVTASVPLVSPITNTLTTFFGDPAARVTQDFGGPAFLTNPSDCGTSPVARIEADSWQDIGNYKTRMTPLLGAGETIQNCSLLTFGPLISMTPGTRQADTPSGFRFELDVPQAPEAAPSLGTPPLKDATVTLPASLVASPAQADGLEACSAGEIDIGGEAIDGFDHNDGQPHLTPGSCPLASKVATAKVTTPLLPEPVEGAVYLGEPDCSPCRDADAGSGKMIRLYIEARSKRYGVAVKLEGKVTANPATGQLQATFLNGPQFPFSKVELDFEDGPQAALSTPLACGNYTANSQLVPWSAPETPNATPAAAFDITSGPGGGPCVSSEAQAPNSPSFVAGVLNPVAASYSPFVLRLNRADGTQRIKGLNLTLPPGLTGKLAGVPSCTDERLASAADRAGKAEQANPSCPAASQVGTVDVGAGAGPQPLHVQGRVYVAGPYKGAPLSMAIVTPAVAGPFDLGTVVVRTALYVNPATAQITARSDPLPTILGGVPLNMRSATVTLDRADFTLNPTSCEAMQVRGEAIAISGDVAQLSNRFKVSGCRELPFKPKLSLRLFGGTRRGSHPKLRAVLTAKPGEANIAKASVALPRSEFLDQAHIRTVCTRVQFAAENCPKGAIYGRVRAFTPLLDEPLEGPVYLRSSDNELPDAVGVLKGPPSRPIQIETSARIDSTKGGIRANFESIPDAPISKVIVTMQGGRKGLLINSANLCKIGKSARRATVKMDGQNGKVHDYRPVVQNDCRR